MLTEIQVNVLEFVAETVWFGLAVGGSVGVIAGASVPIVRTRRVFAALPGCLFAVVPAVGFGIAVSLVFGVLEMVFCNRGAKAGWIVPEWLAMFQALMVIVAGLVGAFRMLRCRPTFRLRTTIALIVAGAVVGCIAHLDTGFDGYFVLESNARPIRQAVIGFLVGGTAVMVWCLLLRLVQRFRWDELAV